MSRARIMVVEDEAIVAAHIEKKLKNLGFEVVAVSHSGEEALSQAAELRPDLVLMDIRLEGDMDGVQAAGRMREEFNIPVIYLTAYADDETLNRAKVTEPFGYLLKPYEARELLSAIDIALYKHTMEEKLRVSEERYALAARGANDGLWDWDLTQDRLFLSAKWKSMAGYEEYELAASPSSWFDLIHPDDVDQVRANIDAHIEGQTSHFESEYRIRHRDGRDRWVFARGLAIRDRKGKAYRMAGSQTNVTDRRLAEEQLVHFTFNDPLTELPNRMVFMGILEQSHRQANNRLGGPRKPFALLVVELDDLARINREHGYWRGDQALASSARIIRGILAESSTPGRLSGAEFVILTEKHADEAGAEALAERVIQALAGPVLVGEPELSLALSASVGITYSQDGYETADALLAAAEDAMREARKRGGSQFVSRRPATAS